MHHRGREQLVPAVRSGGQKGSCGAFLERGRVPGGCGGQQDLEGDAHSVSRCGGLLLVCSLGGFEQLRRRPPPAADEVKQTVFPCVMIAFSAIKCRGLPFAVRFGRCRYAARQRSQRRRPAQGAPDDAGTATRTVPAVRSGGQKGSCGAMRGSVCKVWSLRCLHHFFSALYQCADGQCGEQCHHGGVVVCRHPGVQPPGAGRGSQGLRQDREGDHGGVRALLFVGILWYNCVTRRWLVCLQSFPSVI